LPADLSHRLSRVPGCARQEPVGSLRRPAPRQGRAEEDRGGVDEDRRPHRPQQAQAGSGQLQGRHAEARRSGVTGVAEPRTPDPPPAGRGSANTVPASPRAQSRQRALRRFKLTLLLPLIAAFVLVLTPVLLLQLYFSFHQWTVYLGSWWD